MQVGSVMTRDVVTVALTATLMQAESLMGRGGFRHLPVLRDGVLVGVVSEREVRPPPGVGEDVARALSGRTVEAVMQGGVISIGPDDPIEQAGHMMDHNKIGCLPVLRDGALVGIVTPGDIFRALVRSLGFGEPSTRVELRADDLAQALAGLAAVASQEQIAIAGLLTEREPRSGERRLVVRFATLQRRRLIAALRSRGIAVIDPEPEGEVCV